MRVTVEKDYKRVSKIYLNNEDVTRKCYEADDKNGYAMVYKKNNDGEYILTEDGEDVVKEKLEGNVRIEIKNID
jgi:hypothetical protein